MKILPHVERILNTKDCRNGGKMVAKEMQNDRDGENERKEDLIVDY